MNSAQNKSNAETSAVKAGSHKRGSYFDDYVKLTQNKASQFDGTSFNIWDYLRVEMFGVGEPGNLEPPSKEHLQNFFLVPLYLEGLVFLGFFICMDAFLYVITYLPIRVMFSLYLFIVECYTFSLKFGLGGIINTLLFSETNHKRRLRFHRTHTYDLMRGAMFAVGCIALRQVNMSQVYHLIRGQSMIKLYVLASMIEVFDKLMSSFGQDAFDALHWQTRYNPRSLKMALTFLMTTGYVCIHSLIYFFHIATMTVVINSVDKALITVLILNNFSEMKAFILKKFDCNNLFQLACSDINERFQMFLFLTLVFIVALAQEGTDWMSTVKHFAHIAGLMLLGECVADWMKHAFINKFNFINATVYEDFAYVLRGDILTNQKDEIILDHTYSVTRRLGLSQIPLGCVCIRYLLLALATPQVQLYLGQLSTMGVTLRMLGVFLCLVALKVAIGVGLVFYSTGAHRRDAAIFTRQTATVPEPAPVPAAYQLPPTPSSAPPSSRTASASVSASASAACGVPSIHSTHSIHSMHSMHSSSGAQKPPAQQSKDPSRDLGVPALAPLPSGGAYSAKRDALRSSVGIGNSSSGDNNNNSNSNSNSNIYGSLHHGNINSNSNSNNNSCSNVLSGIATVDRSSHPRNPSITNPFADLSDSLTLQHTPLLGNSPLQSPLGGRSRNNSQAPPPQFSQSSHHGMQQQQQQQEQQHQPLSLLQHMQQQSTIHISTSGGDGSCTKSGIASPHDEETSTAAAAAASFTPAATIAARASVALALGADDDADTSAAPALHYMGPRLRPRSGGRCASEDVAAHEGLRTAPAIVVGAESGVGAGVGAGAREAVREEAQQVGSPPMGLVPRRFSSLSSTAASSTQSLSQLDGEDQVPTGSATGAGHDDDDDDNNNNQATDEIKCDPLTSSSAAGLLHREEPSISSSQCAAINEGLRHRRQHRSGSGSGGYGGIGSEYGHFSIPSTPLELSPGRPRSDSASKSTDITSLSQRTAPSTQSAQTAQTAAAAAAATAGLEDTAEGTALRQALFGAAMSADAEAAEAELRHVKDRLEFMEELSNMERYTVYKGRII